MEDIDQALQSVFQNAFQTPEQSDRAWRDFVEEQLPEKLAWSAFALAMAQIEARFQQVMAQSWVSGVGYRVS